MILNTLISAGVILTSIVAGASGDALNDKGKKLWGHRLEALEIGVLVASPFIIPDVNWFTYVAGYAFLRGGLFDLTYNVVRGNKLTYNGDSSGWDKFFKKMPPIGKWIWMIWMTAVGASALILDL